MSENKNGQTEISISLDNDLYELLKNYADDNDTDISSLIQDLIENNQNLYSPKKSFVTLGAYSNEKNRVIFNQWSLLGTTILHEKEWIELFKLLKFKGDYYFTTANKLNLC